MKKIVYFWIILLFSFSLTIGQTNGNGTVRKPLQVSQFAEAEKAWGPFWGNVKTAIRMHDRESLKELISVEYRCYSRCGNYVDKRDAFFDLFESLDSKWWGQLGWIFEKGTRVGKIRNEDGKMARTVSSDKSRELGTDADFSYQKNGKWYFTEISGWGM